MSGRSQLTTAKPRRPLRRAFLCVTTIGFLLVLAGGAWVWSHPIRADWIHERIVAKLRKAAGVDIAYDSASLDLPHQLYEFQNLRFTDPKQAGQELLSLASLTLHVRPLALLAGRETFIRDIEIAQPSVLDVRYDKTGVQLGPRLAFLAKLTRAQSARDGDSEPASVDMPMQSFRIRDAKIRFEEITTSTETGGPEIRPTAVLVGDIVARSSSARKVLATFEGTGFAPPPDDKTITGRPIASGIKSTASFSRNKEGSQVELSGSIGTASLADLFSNLPGTSASGTDVQIELKAKRGRELSDVQFAFDAGGLDVTSAEHGIDIHDENVQGLIHSTYTSGTGELQIEDARASSSLVALETSGTVEIAARHAYNLNVSASRLTGGYRKLLTRFLPQGWNVTAPQEGMSLDTRIAGNSRQLNAVNGQFRFRDISLATPHLQQPVKELSGAIDLATDTLTIHNLSGRYGQTNLAIAGDIRGDFLRKREGQLNLAWNTSSTPDDLMAMVQQVPSTRKGNKPPPKLQKPKSRGTITGTGTYQQFVSLATGGGTLPPQVGGTINVRGAGFSHPSLPAPIEELNGALHIDGDRLVVDNLSGTLRDTKVLISGLLKGRGVFWEDPSLSASVTTKLDLAQIITYLPAEQKQTIMRNRISGDATTKFTLSGSLKQLGEARFAGSVQLHNVALQPQLEFMSGGFTGLDGEVQWDGRALKLNDLHGELNGESVRASGTLSPDAISLDLAGVADLAAVIKTFPQLEKWLEMSGPAKFDVHFGVGDAGETQSSGKSPLPIDEEDSDASTNRLVALFGQLPPRLEEAVASKQYKLVGEVEFQGSNIRHRAMPIERREGKQTIPRGEVRNMRGTAHIETDAFRVAEDSPVICDFSDTKNCRLSGLLQLRSKDLPEMSVKIESRSQLQLDSWITGWGTELPKTPAPPDTGKTFQLRAKINAPSVIYKGQRGGQSSGEVSFYMLQDGKSPRKTTFKSIQIAGAERGLGRLVGEGTIDSFVWEPGSYPKWQTKVDVDRMPLQSMLTAVFKEPTTLSGLVAVGNIELSGVGNDAERITGGGSAQLSDLVVGGTPVFQQIGQQTGRTFGGRYFQTADAAVFRVGNGALSSTDVQLNTSGMSMDIRGDYYFAGNRQQGIPEKTISGLMKINFLKSVFGGIPLLGDLAKFADDIAGGLLLAFRVSGNADHPNITPIPLPLFSGALPLQ